MTQRGNEVAGIAAERSCSEEDSSRTATVLFAVGLVVVAVNSALYFFGAESLSHPAASVLGLALLLPLYLKER